MSRNILAVFVLMVIVTIGCGFGIFAAMGACIALWDGEGIRRIFGVTLDHVLAPGRDHTHPASRAFPWLIGPGMVVGIVGSLVVFYRPLCYLFPDLLRIEVEPYNRRLYAAMVRYERHCAEAWLRHIDAELERHGEKKPPLEVEP